LVLFPNIREDFQDVLDKLSDVGKKDQLLKFFKLVQDGKFPFNNIGFELFLDRTPSLLTKSLSISKYLYPFKRVSTPILH
jgi:hypothetical protein